MKIESGPVPDGPLAQDDDTLVLKAREDLSGRDRIAWNVLLSWGGYLVEVVTGFMVPRLMDRQIGQTALGVWDLAWSCVAYFRFVQIGIAPATSRYLARHRAMRDVEGLRRVATTSLGVSVGVALLVLSLTAGLTWSLPLLLGSRLGDQVATAQWVVAILGAGLAFNFLCDVFSGILTSSHRWDLHNAINSGSQLMIATAMIATLSLGGGLRDIALMHTAGVVVGELVRMAVAHRICPELRIRPSYWSTDQARRMLTFGAKASLGPLATLILRLTNNLVVASHLGPAALALYARPNALLRVANNLVAKMAFVLTPTASSLQGTGRQTEISELVLKGTRAATALVVPMFWGLVILGGPLLRLWMGARYEQGLLLAILVLATAPRLTQQPALSVLIGLDLHGYVAVWTLGAAICGVGLTFLNVIVLELGLVGAALAVTIPHFVVTGFIVPRYVCRRLGIPLSVFLRQGYLAPVACGIPFAAILLASRIAFADRPALALACGTVVGGLVLALLYWKFVIPDQARELVLRLVPEAVAGRLRPRPSTRPVLDRPVFIMASPRSGSTLLFETLIVSESLWSLGGEGHGIVERHPELRPGPQGSDSNRLTEEHLTQRLAEAICNDLISGMRDRAGNRYRSGSAERPRLLEKTPKNVLRIPFLNAIFPDALFIYLCRDPKENVSSIMEGWRSRRFVSYPDKQGSNGPWSFLLPPGWRTVIDQPLADVAAFQWDVAHRHALQDLGALPRERWIGVNYAEFLQDTLQVVQRLCEFMGISMDAGLRRHCSGSLPMSRYTLTKPSKDKWKKNGREIARVLPRLRGTISDINRAIGSETWPLSDELNTDLTELEGRPEAPAQAPADEPFAASGDTIRRNDPCPCGSGRRYKACHGSL